MARSGMSNLIQRVRDLCDAGTAEYTAGTVVHWSNDDIQDILDSNSMLLIDAPLTWLPQTIGGGTINYLIAQSPYRDFEEVASGTARWIIRDATGAQIGTANYTPDYRGGRVTFTSDQGGSAYFLTAYTYDIHAAAADVWRQRLAHFTDWYNFTYKLGDSSETFSRDQAFQHAKDMLREMEKKAGSNVVSAASGDLRTSQFLRTDISYSGGWGDY
jgi:hypothetical protein